MELEGAMKQEINRCREQWNPPLPLVEDFVTIRFHNGVIVMPAEDFKKLSKAKQKKN